MLIIAIAWGAWGDTDYKQAGTKSHKNWFHSSFPLHRFIFIFSQPYSLICILDVERNTRLLQATHRDKHDTVVCGSVCSNCFTGQTNRTFQTNLSIQISKELFLYKIPNIASHNKDHIQSWNNKHIIKSEKFSNQIRQL